MNNTSNEAATTAQDVRQLVTFSVGDTAFGIDIAFVQEINPHLDVTKVPGASPMIHGVVNLRGDVVTVLDPHRILRIAADTAPKDRRNLVLNIGGERIGVLVDKVSDILTVNQDELSQKPANVRSVDRRLIDAVVLRNEQLVVILNATKLLEVVEQSSETEAA
ncbi:Chemotaxis protein CheW [Planctomycetes bacterium CA13]|uniref:Chemotaxis protein CheW n=1 Tax=Novipirellula herctigrandis TaxID=2527986 RepID=A0A5C5YVU7_9BACT|nr:Chemotaxis protein CheW [Planctomycetes bacterium CA13]